MLHVPVLPADPGTRTLNARLKTSASIRSPRATPRCSTSPRLPVAVLSCLLGLGVTTATAWTHHAGQHAGYAAELTQRQCRH